MYRSQALLGSPKRNRRPPRSPLRSAGSARPAAFSGARRRPGGSSAPKRNKGKGQYIDPARFVQIAKPLEQDVYVPTNQFADFAVNTQIHANLSQKGFTTPTPIQDQSIPAGLAGKDIIGIANTGTGKTVAFALPVLNRLMAEPGSRALIIAPTRELAQQIEAECRALGKGSGLFGTLLIGGTAMGPQLRDLRSRPQIIIGTPGRIKDHLERGSLQLNDCSMVVLDEVDRMLDMGFIADVRSILSKLSPNRQSFFFSATLDGTVRTLIEGFANDPMTVMVKSGTTSENVHQDIVRVQGSAEKVDKLHDILITPGVDKVILFEETQRKVERLHKNLITRGFKAESIHGGKTQGQRQRALERFKANQANILVATDVAARGIDVVDITHVINFSQPGSYEDYVHRIGRAGRAGRVGYALTFVD